jgi:thiosulfate/3-mercaptopyruvate sulfurtransferase
VVVVDGSWYLPAMNRDAGAEFRDAHIPGAVADAEIAHHRGECLRARQHVRQRAGGVADQIDVDPPRVRWMFRVFGARDVAVLDGGFPAWQAEGRPVETIVMPSPMPRLRIIEANASGRGSM